MARHQKNNRGFALIFAAVLTAALAVTVASVTTTAGVMQQQAAARKWSVIARSLAEQGMSRALADVRAISSVEGDSDLDRLLDPDRDDSARCPVGGCTTSESPGTPQDNNLPRDTIRTVGSNSYASWGSATETFGGETYRRVNSGTGAYLVRYDDNLDDNATGFDSTTGNNTVPEGGGTDTLNRDRDMHIYVTSVGFAGGTTESTAKSRYVIRALVRTIGGKTVRAGSYVDTGTNGDICGAGLQMCRRNGTTMPGCWCGELEIDDSNYSSGGPTLPSTCTDCGTNCPPASFRETPGLCAQLAAGPPKPPEYLTEIELRATHGALVTDTSYTKGQCLFRVDLNRSVRLNSGPTNNTFEAVVHVWDPNAHANCRTTNLALPVPDFDFSTWSMGADTAAKDCWVPVFVKDTAGNGCLWDIDSGAQSAWITPDCRIDATAAFINSDSVGGTDGCTGGNGTLSTGAAASASKWCPGKSFNGFINAMDSITSSNNGSGHSAAGMHRFNNGADHDRILGVRAANTAGIGATAGLTQAINGRTDKTWANVCGCVGCTDNNNLGIEIDAETGAVTVDANGPKGTYLVYQGNANATLTVNNGTAASYSRTALYFTGLGNITVVPETYMEGPWNPSGTSPSKTWALTNKGNCILNSSNNSKSGFRKGIWCEGNIVLGTNNNVHWMGDLTAGDTTSIAQIYGGANSNYWCAATTSSCPSATACGTQRGTIWTSGNISLSDNGGGTGPDVCMDLKATLNVTINSNSNNGWVSGTIWSGGNASGPRLQVDPGGSSMMGASPSVLSFQSFAF